MGQDVPLTFPRRGDYSSAYMVGILRIAESKKHVAAGLPGEKLLSCEA